MFDEVIRIMCPNLVCRKVLGVPKSARGRAVRCRACGTVIMIPEQGQNPRKPSKKSGGPPGAQPGRAA